MKILLSFLIVCFACIACNDAVDLTSINKDLDNRNATISPQGIIVPAPTYQWYELPDEEMEAPDGYYFLGSIFKCNGNVYARNGTHEYNTYKLNVNTKAWELHPINLNQFYQNYYILFSNGSYLYGLSMDGQNRVGAININSGDFLLRAPFPGVYGDSYATVTIGNNAYLMGGTTSSSTINQFWKFDFVRNQWTDLGKLPGGSRGGASAFVVEDKIYFGLGYQIRYVNNTKVKTYKSDWLLIDPNNTSNYYITRANFPGEPRAHTTGFVINNKVYLGWAAGDSRAYDDFWEFNPSTNTWAEKATPESVKQMKCFSVDDTGYAVDFGGPGRFWQYKAPATVTPVP